MLLAQMPELGALTGKQAASLASLAPHPKDSGNFSGYRRIQGGRPLLKKALFVCGWSASRHHPALKLFYQNLIAQGKKPIVAMIAVARGLIVILNAKLRDLTLQPLLRKSYFWPAHFFAIVIAIENHLHHTLFCLKRSFDCLLSILYIPA